MPNRCVLNGLQSVAVPPELQRPNCLEKHLVQRAKFFVCVVIHWPVRELSFTDW